MIENLGRETHQTSVFKLNPKCSPLDIVPEVHDGLIKDFLHQKRAGLLSDF